MRDRQSLSANHFFRELSEAQLAEIQGGGKHRLSCTIVDFNGDVDNSNRLFDGWGAASHL